MVENPREFEKKIWLIYLNESLATDHENNKFIDKLMMKSNSGLIATKISVIIQIFLINQKFLLTTHFDLFFLFVVIETPTKQICKKLNDRIRIKTIF